MSEHIEPMYSKVISTLYPVLQRITFRDWAGMANIPTEGGFVAASNHISNMDHFPLAHYLVSVGRAPHYLAKSSLFKPPGVRQIMQGTGQIPVYRGTAQATSALAAATEALQRGACVCVYPEGTITREPDFWPMVGKSGAARLALESNVPLVPMAIWGTREMMWPYRDKLPKLLPRKLVHVTAGPAIDLDDLRDGPIDAQKLRTATTRLMAEITRLLEGIRHEQAPATPFDPRNQPPARDGDTGTAPAEETR
ncbi:lysophospholipid acyltransferase family protein [Flexivirga caeni]|uniref:1-acyl-sn-glycerol-3-phosphate acyltransferase n=1 Tax=Flexivirga caeni TaxID=2294115 RepID=A0A3M9MF46_9MICO|nr:lysophospholipid acyltransferase family protein [Flexivirga caeni]RNI23258.1 1-acyl-sn-glycerol-3-phosphate acyltransferase [Flexivirga caeni]